MKNIGARRVRLPSCSDGTWWYNSRWTWSIESKCSRYIEMMMAFQICETRTFGLYLISMSCVARILA